MNHIVEKIGNVPTLRNLGFVSTSNCQKGRMTPKAWIKPTVRQAQYIAERELTESEERRLVPDAGVLRESCCVIRVEDYEY